MIKINSDQISIAKRHMGTFAPKKFIIDNKRHFYTVFIDGQPRRASYIAICNPFEETGLALLCSYGLLDKEEEHTYSSSMH